MRADDSAARGPAKAGSSRLVNGTSGAPSMSATSEAVKAAGNAFESRRARWTFASSTSGSRDGISPGAPAQVLVRWTLYARHGARLASRRPLSIERGQHEGQIACRRHRAGRSSGA